MKSIETEHDFQEYIIRKLVRLHNYERRKAADNFDDDRAQDADLLLAFLENTQPNVLRKIKSRFADWKDKILTSVDNACKKYGTLKVLRRGVDIENTAYHLTLLYQKPETTFNSKAIERYESNIFSVMDEINAVKGARSKRERVDLGIFINGIPVALTELKYTPSGKHQTYEDAINQWKTDRSPNYRLFRPKGGALVYFAQDENEVYMTTKLEGEKTVFRPFNKGRGEGIGKGKGNPSGYSISTAYMWEEILEPDNLLEIIFHQIFEDKGSLIFPRYHQLDLLRKTCEDVRKNGAGKNYLYEHSAGSGKTYSIAWLASKLATIHNAKNEAIFDGVVVVSDRLAIDKSNQEAIKNLNSALGREDSFIKVLSDGATSSDLSSAILSGDKIVVTTIQKFIYAADDIKNQKGKNFAVIIDEAHSSTAGEEMSAMARALTSGDKLEAALASGGVAGAENISFFAFTATPKKETLKLFGTKKRENEYVPFHTYSMKQAIEEKYIVDPIQNYTEYSTFYSLNKIDSSDPLVREFSAKAAIEKLVAENDMNIQQRVELIVEHFRVFVKNDLGGHAKAMVVTPTRLCALKYFKAIKKYIKKKGYSDLAPLVAFSDEVELDGKTYTEHSVNGFSEKETPKRFKEDKYKFLVVANKYQTGFDEPYLCAMYVLKPLEGVNAVQTLSRLNRACAGYVKQPKVLDFVNKFDDIKRAFAPYYDTTSLIKANDAELDSKSLYDLMDEIKKIGLFNDKQLEAYIDAVESKGTNKSDDYVLETISAIFGEIEKNFAELQDIDQRNFLIYAKRFHKLYQMLNIVSGISDKDLPQYDGFISTLEGKFSRKYRREDADVSKLVVATGFSQKEGESHINEGYSSSGLLEQGFDIFSVPEDVKKSLTEIVERFNREHDTNYSPAAGGITIDTIIRATMSVSGLKEKARTNSQEDFELAFYDALNKILIELYEQNRSMIGAFLSDPDEMERYFAPVVSKVQERLCTSDEDMQE